MKVDSREIKNQGVLEIMFDNGLKTVCTPNHLFMLVDGTYKEAQYLSKKDNIFSLSESILKNL